jgi:hypothetical protein
MVAIANHDVKLMDESGASEGGELVPVKTSVREIAPLTDLTSSHLAYFHVHEASGGRQMDLTGL